MTGILYLGERHNVLTVSKNIDGVSTYGAACTLDACGWFEAADGITEALRVGMTHNPRCEAVTEHDRHPISLSCQRMALHEGDHQHVVRWA